MRGKSVLTILLALWGSATAIGRVSAAEDHNLLRRSTLRGLVGMSVVVEILNQELEQDMGTKSQLQTDVELRLRMAGIHVLEWQDALDAPYLYVKVSGMKDSPNNFYVYVIGVYLNQRVYLSRDPSIALFAPTSDITVGGYVGGLMVRQLRQVVIDQVEQFINAYLAVNSGQASRREQRQPQPGRKQSASFRPSPPQPSFPFPSK